MNPRLLRPIARNNFDPKTIPNLTGWYLATDSASYTESSGQISEWRDKSGAGNHLTQTTANNRPTLFESSSDTQNSTRAVINGRQALFFDGVNDRLLTTNTVTSGQSRTVFAIAKRIDNSTTATVACFGVTVVQGISRWLCRFGRSAELAVGGDSTTTNQTVSSLLAWDTAHLSCWSQNSSNRNLTYLLNNTSYAITGNPPVAQTSFAGLTVGALVAGASIIQFMNGVIGELVIYDRELSVSERNTVTRGIAARWGIAVA
jgi:hypothetical protein